MPTNRNRKMRTSRRRPSAITDEYRESLIAKDFLGELTEDEILIAKELGVYCWDPGVKKSRGRKV
jgi:hypothetical protein